MINKTIAWDREVDIYGSRKLTKKGPLPKPKPKPRIDANLSKIEIFCDQVVTSF